MSIQVNKPDILRHKRKECQDQSVKDIAFVGLPIISWYGVSIVSFRIEVFPTDSNSHPRLIFENGHDNLVSRKYNGSCTVRIYCSSIDGLVQDCIIVIPSSMEMVQSCIKPSVYTKLAKLCFCTALRMNNKSRQKDLPLWSAFCNATWYSVKYGRRFF